MPYQVFQNRVNSLIASSGISSSVVFSHDEETGTHIARISDGTTIIGNSTSSRVSVRWGSGHSAMAEI